MPKTRHPKLAHPADLVWAAACAAYRINDGYYKHPETTPEGKVSKPSNRELVYLYLADQSRQFITDADRRQSQKCRQALSNSATMSALKDRLTEWGALTVKMAELETVTTDYEVSVITAMPKSYIQNLDREKIDSRLARCESTPLATAGEQIKATGEVIRSGYSTKYGTFYTTVITNTNHQIFFAYRERIDIGKTIDFCGRVKRHADRATQLSRVKLIKKEVA